MAAVRTVTENVRNVKSDIAFTAVAAIVSFKERQIAVMPKNKPRRLWLQLRSDTPGASDKEVIDMLVQSISNGDYDYRTAHPTWRVAIGWKNKENVPFKWGEFRREMEQSAQSSPGFDYAVMEYLRSQLR
jgi:hypothetical protein